MEGGLEGSKQTIRLKGGVMNGSEICERFLVIHASHGTSIRSDHRLYPALWKPT